MPKGDQEVESIKNRRGFNDAVVVELAEVLDGGHSPLILSWIVFLKPHANLFQHAVNEGDDEVLMVSEDAGSHVGHVVDVHKLDLPDLHKPGEGEAIHLLILPRQLPQLLDDIFNGFLAEIDIKQLPNKFFHWISLLHNGSDLLWGIALREESKSKG